MAAMSATSKALPGLEDDFVKPQPEAGELRIGAGCHRYGSVSQQMKRRQAGQRSSFGVGLIVDLHEAF